MKDAPCITQNEWPKNETKRWVARQEDRLLVIHAAGNEYGEATQSGNAAWGVPVTSDIPGQITVGATNLGSPLEVGDEAIAGFSSPGQVELSAPGVGVPVGAGTNSVSSMLSGLAGYAE